MPKTIQIRNVDDEVYAALQRRAAERGETVPQLLRRQAEMLARRPSMQEWLERVGRKPPTGITSEEIIATMDEWRGPWPDGGG